VKTLDQKENNHNFEILQEPHTSEELEQFIVNQNNKENADNEVERCDREYNDNDNSNSSFSNNVTKNIIENYINNSGYNHTKNEIIEMIERLRIENSKLNDNIINYFATYLINNQNGCFVDTSYFVAWRKHRNIIEKQRIENIIKKNYIHHS